MFTNNPGHYDLPEGQAFLERLHAAGQYFFPILDPHVYIPDPTNASDAYETWNRGDELQVYIRDGIEAYYNGVYWAGLANLPDFLVEQTQTFWTEEFVRFYNQLAYDGFWLDVSDPTSFATYSLPDVTINPIHVPFDLPGDPESSVAVDYHYPEQFAVTNASEAASASAALASQSSAYPMMPTPTPTHQRTEPTPGVRQLNFPPYAIKNDAIPGNSLVKQVVAPNATHNDGPYNSTEYELHNLYGHMSSKATSVDPYISHIRRAPWSREAFNLRDTSAPIQLSCKSKTLLTLIHYIALTHSKLPSLACVHLPLPVAHLPARVLLPDTGVATPVLTGATCTLVLAKPCRCLWLAFPCSASRHVASVAILICSSAHAGCSSAPGVSGLA